MSLQLSTTRQDAFAVVSVAGDIDLETAAQLGDEALRAAQQDSAHVVLDLGGVTFMDSSGLKVLISIQRRAELAGGSLSLVDVPRPVSRVLSVTGLAETFPTYDSVDEVVASDSQAQPGS
jgi:anti-sigma B factor antagonist